MSRIACVGLGAQATATTSPLSVTPPNGVQAGDLMVMLIGATPSGTAGTNDTVTITGWTQRGTTSRQEIGTIDVSVQLWYKVASAGEGAVSVAAGTALAGGTAGYSGQIEVFRGVDQTTPWDATSVNSGGAAAATFTPTGITTVTNNAVAISAVCSADNNSLAFSTSQSFALPMSGASYSNTTGFHHAVGLACKEIAVAGAVTVPTWSETANGNDAWAAISAALRPDTTTWTLEETWMGLNGAAWPASPWSSVTSSTGASATLDRGTALQTIGTVGSYGDAVRAMTNDAVFPDNFDLLVDSVYGTTNLETYADIYFRDDGTLSGNQYLLSIGSGNGFNYLQLQSRVAYSATILATSPTLATLTLGDIVHLRLRAVGISFYFRWWLNNAAEPGTWDVGPITDFTYRTGGMGLTFEGGAAAVSSVTHWRALRVQSVPVSDTPTSRYIYRPALTRAATR